MIAALWTAIILVMLVAAASLAFGLLLARRYRELHQVVRDRPAVPPSAFDLPAEDTPIGTFSAPAIDGAIVSSSDFDGADTAVAVVMVGCEPCTKELPGIRALFSDLAGRHPQPLALVVGEGDEEKSAYISELESVARVVVEGLGGPVARALSIHRYPSVLLVGNGVIRRAGDRARDLVEYTSTH